MTTHSDYTIRALQPHETIRVRNSELRPGQPVEQCHFEGDDDATTFHIGAVNSNGEVVGVATVLCSNELRYKQFSSQRQFQLRAMAVDLEFQRQGIGKTLLTACVEEATKRDGDMFWCNARLVAVDFYRKYGLSVLNDVPFDIQGIGPHHVMFKQLNS